MEGQVDVMAETDEAVFVALYPQLRRFAAVAAPAEVDPDDLVQDALERTLRVRSLASLSNPRAYLFRVIVNQASNYRRSFGRARLALARTAEPDGTSQSYPSDVSELLRLPARQRAMVFLREVEGLSYGEIGELFGMSQAAVEKASQRARSRLRAALRGQGDR